MNSKIDKIILQKFELNDDSESLNLIDDKLNFCSVLDLIIENGFDVIKDSRFSYEITDYIKSSLIKNGLIKELSIPERTLKFNGQMIDFLISTRSNLTNEFAGITRNLELGTFDDDLYKYNAQISRIFGSKKYQFIVFGNTSSLIVDKSNYERIIRNINQAKDSDSEEDKFNLYQKNKEFLNILQSEIELSQKYIRELLLPIIEYLKKQFNSAHGAEDIKDASIEVTSTEKKYNFKNTSLENLDLHLRVTNKGEGLARNISIEFFNELESDSYNISSLKPNEEREITINAKSINFEKFSGSSNIKLKWQNFTNKYSETNCIIEFNQQLENISWEDLAKSKPYTIKEIEDINKLYGRNKIISELRNNIFSDNIESYKIWGQKRVGKSSIVKTLKSLFADNNSVVVVYVSLGNVRNVDPIATLNSIGNAISKRVVDEITKKQLNNSLLQNIRKLDLPVFSGSLNPLEDYLDDILSLFPDFKFVFILDEFDRINSEFFLPGTIGETLSLNIGKGINQKPNVGFILVGSENMQLLERQGINYNSYLEKEIDTFDKKTEYDSFINIVIGPTEGYLNFSTESIDLIYNYTNGNPYFSNLICSKVYKICEKNFDSDVDKYIVEKAIKEIVNSSQKNHFEHFWADGLAEETSIKNEKKTDIRRRMLITYSFFNSENKEFPTRKDLIKRFKTPSEYSVEKYEIEQTVIEFFNRKIFLEGDANDSIRIVPKIFEDWLCGPGKTLMIEGVSDLEKLHKEQEIELELLLKQDELSKINENIIYQNKKIQNTELKNYFSQFGGAINQRKVFNLISNIVYISVDDLREFFKKNQKLFFTKKEIHIKERARTFQRKNIGLYAFDDFINEERELQNIFKGISHINRNQSFKPLSIFNTNSHQEIEDIIILCSSIRDFSEIKNQLDVLLEFQNEKMNFILISIVITSNVKTEIINHLNNKMNFKIVEHIEIEDNLIMPFQENQEIFETTEESNEVYILNKRFFPNTTKNSLNLLIETHCPSTSIPILWKKNKNFNPLFLNDEASQKPEIESYSETNGESRREEIYKLNVVFEQKFHQVVIGYVKRKAEIDQTHTWFHTNYIPKKIIEDVFLRFTSENMVSELETYFDFAHFKSIAEQHPFLKRELDYPGSGLTWCDRLNKLRRIPAHTIKTPPTQDDVNYYKSISNYLLPKFEILINQIKSSEAL